MSKWYGSVHNRLEEGRMYCDEIKVGTGMTEYYYSDRKAYEVVEVKDQKHVTVRMYDVKHVGGPYQNDWELISNPENPVRELEKRGDIWFWSSTITAEALSKIPADDLPITKLNLALAGFNYDTIMEKGRQTKRHKANVSFGVADYYYDYEF